MPQVAAVVRRSCALVAASALLIGVSSGASADETGATDSPAAFVARASAAGVRVTYGMPGFLVVSDFVDGGGPFVDTAVDSAGGNAFASLPYPGQLVIAGPGLLAAFGGPSLPYGYPFYASASHPAVPSGATADPSGSYEIKADAGPAAAAGTARFSTGKADAAPMHLTTTADVEQTKDGSVVATAKSVIQGLSIGDGALTITRLVSQSVTTAAPGSTPKTEESLQIDGAKVGSTPVTIGPDGVKAAGANLPAGPGSTDALNKSLEAAGMAVRLVAAQDVDGGRRGALLEVRSIHQIPGGATGNLVLQFGAVSSSVVLGGAAPAPAPYDAATTPPAGDGGPALAVESAPSGVSGLSSGASPAFAEASAVPSPTGFETTGPGEPALAGGLEAPAATETASAAVPGEPAGAALAMQGQRQLTAAPAANLGGLSIDVRGELKGLYLAAGLLALALSGAAAVWRHKKGMVAS